MSYAIRRASDLSAAITFAPLSDGQLSRSQVVGRLAGEKLHQDLPLGNHILSHLNMLVKGMTNGMSETGNVQGYFYTGSVIDPRKGEMALGEILFKATNVNGNTTDTKIRNKVSIIKNKVGQRVLLRLEFLSEKGAVLESLSSSLTEDAYKTPEGTRQAFDALKTEDGFTVAETIAYFVANHLRSELKGIISRVDATPKQG